MPPHETVERSYVFTDTEFTNLLPQLAQLVELAYAVEDGPVLRAVLPHTLAGADPIALDVMRYFERGLDLEVPDAEALARFARAVRGNVLVGANISCDEDRLTRALGWQPWHHRKIDVENVAMTVFGLDAPPGLREIRVRLVDLGWQIADPDHTAAGDVAVTREVFHALRRIRAHLLRAGLPRRGDLLTAPPPA